MNRITNQHLERLCATINDVTNSPQEPWTREGDKLRANIGNYHISGAYGGVCLHRMMNESGGVESIIPGYTPKRELFNKMHAYLSGLMARD